MLARPDFSHGPSEHSMSGMSDEKWNTTFTPKQQKNNRDVAYEITWSQSSRALIHPVGPQLGFLAYNGKSRSGRKDRQGPSLPGKLPILLEGRAPKI